MSVVTGGLAGERLVGRQGELSELDRRLDELRSSGAGVQAICGEPGIGKTRLLGELATRARARGCLVLAGRALEFESDVPFAPIVDALDEHLGGLDSRRLTQLDAEQIAELAAVFPSLTAGSNLQRPVMDAERYRLHRSVAELLGTLATGRALVVVLDDLHWADEASLELLGYLLRRPPRGRLLIALAYRPRQAPARLVSALDHASRGGAQLYMLELAPLTESDTRTLLAGSGLDVAACETIHAHSGGNPFYAEQLARAGIVADSPPTLAAPAAVVAAIDQEVGTLEGEARSLLLGAAVAGDPFDATLAAAAANLDPPAAAQILDTLTARDLVRPTDSPGRFAFRHPIVRGALYSSASTSGRLAAHARAVGALKRQGAGEVAVAHHLERCAQQGDSDAAEQLAQAAAEVAPRAPATAARWYEAALALDPGCGDRRRCELLVALARALAAVGRLEAARERLEQALALMPTDPERAGGELIAFCAGLDQLLGRHAEAHARLVAALERMPHRASPARLALETELALQPGYAYEASPESDRAARAIASATLEDRATAASVQAALTIRTTLLGQIPVAIHHADTATALIDALDDHELATHLGAPHCLGGAELYLNRYQHAAAHLTRGVRLARATGQGRYLIPMLAHLASAQAALGRLSHARRSAEDALDTARLAGPPLLLLWALIYAGYVELHAGDIHATHAHAREAHELAERFARSVFTAKAFALLGTVCTELDDPERALVLFRHSNIADVNRHEAALRSPFWEPLVRTLLALGERDEAERLLARIDGVTAPLQLPIPRMHAHRARAQLLLADDQPADAAHHALEAVDDADAIDAVVDAARARLLAGRGLAAAGDSEAARRELRHAHQALAAYGADGHRDHAARALRDLGQRVPRPSRRPRAPRAVRELSEREHQIAQLVADGLTNQQIAHQLHLSPKTVEMHLTRTYTKLGIARRAALARMLADTS